MRQQCDSHDLPNVTAFAVTATPASCAQLGVHGVFGDGPFDLVVSGINAGANIGRDVLYSGTVGAALTAHLLGVPAIAVSLDIHSACTAYWDTGAWAIREVIEMGLTQRQSEPLMFNVNVQNRPVIAIRGVQFTSFCTHSFLNQYRFEHDVTGTSTLSVIHKGTDCSHESEMWTDSWALAQAYISVTPVRPFPDLMRVTPWGISTGITAPPPRNHTEEVSLNFSTPLGRAVPNSTDILQASRLTQS
jgi:5'-nucleotidase